MRDRELAYQKYINEVTANGNTRIDNIILCNGGERAHQHIATQVDMAFQAGWHAALDAVRADYEAMIPDNEDRENGAKGGNRQIAG